ncbi:hypothetical protein [Microbacterium marinilacus]|uniref:Uncharacterized protein n=1 Tax=Microbacterium marinilacus TaxID=415209 RepID=A0ABP7BGS0_9MICO|nr:hypothetical protein [Microbacterium marinilacus]MBY0689636.1 hypothetical protein [Microbacterium marinilacus]
MPSRLASLGLAAVLVASITACTPTPEPTPTPTGFSTEEEAFAAAEELYRDHVDELNAYYAGSNPEYEPADYLSGQPLAEEQSILEQMDDLGLRIEGALVIRSLERGPAELVGSAWSIELRSCLDSSTTRVLDADGEDVTPARDELIALRSEIATAEGGGLRIVSSVVNEDAVC